MAPLTTVFIANLKFFRLSITEFEPTWTNGRADGQTEVMRNAYWNSA